ncbi:MAG: SpaH/EbpB family LPXTG-anchored major pilin [Acutalibacteraceae bacterium]
MPDNFTVTQGCGDQHAALDIAADTGTPVVATDDGTVTVTQTWNGIVTKGDSNSYGNMVQVTHADGTVTLYAHLSEINVRQGDTVVRGQQIGRVGSTGNSSGPHLHFEVRSNGSKVDPMAYIAEDSTDAEKKFEELLEQYGGYIGEDGQLRTIDGREAIDKTLVEIAEEAGLNPPVFYANNVTVTESRSTYIMNIGYKTNVEDMNGWGGKRVNGRVAYCVEHGVALGLGDNGGYTQRELTKEQLAKLTLIDYWGRYKNIANVKGCSAVNYNWDTIDVSAEYMAEFYTQLLIWETINSFGGSFVGASSVSIPSTVGGMDNIASQSTYNAFKKAVLAKVDQFYTTPSIDGQTVTMKIGETVTLTDTTGALASYKDTPSANTTGISVTKQGDTITLKATGTPKENGTIVFGYNVDREFIDLGTGFYYEHTVSQDVATCGFAGRDPAYITLNVNVEMNGSLKIVKTSEDGVVSGVRFNVTGDGVNTTVQTGPDGTITIPNLQDGTVLTVTELTSDQYVQPQSQTVTIKANQTATVNFSNVLKKWTATVTKRDSSTGTAQGDASLAGAIYGVYRGNDLIDQYTTDTNGQFTTKEYVCGDSWYIKEIAPSPGYQLDGTRYPVGAAPGKFTLEHNQIPITVHEQVKLNKISITKYADMVNGSDVPEEGAVFEVYLKSAGSYANADTAERDRITTNASGYAVTKDLPFGTYVLHQVAGSDGRELAPDQEVTITEDKPAHATYGVSITNSLKLGGLEIRKSSEDGKLKDWEFEITRDIDDWSLVVKTDSNGRAVAEDLPVYADVAGKQPIRYTVTEINVGDKYKQPEPQTVTLTEHAVVTVDVENRIARGSIQLLKVDHDGVTPLEGAVYRFWYEDGTEITTETTDADGRITVENILYGKFFYQEQTAPEGYDLDETIYEAAVEHDGQVITVTRENTPSVGSITVTKVDTSGTPMSGVSFALQFSTDDGVTWDFVTAREADSTVSIGGCDSPGLENGVLTTGEDGIAAFTGLQVDNQTVTILYRLTEVSTQDGTVLLGDILFEGSLPASIDGEKVADVTITAVNGRNFELPGAGGGGFPFLPFGVFLAVTALCAAFFILSERGKQIMKKTKIFTRLGAVVLAVAMCFNVVTASAATVPDATIDPDRAASLELYKYDFTTANEDGVLTDSTFVSTGQHDSAVEEALAPYALQGVIYTYAKVADIMTYSEQETTGYKDMVLYALPDNSASAEFLAALGLSRDDAYRIDHNELQFMSDTLIDGLAGQLGSIESQTKNALEAYVHSNGGIDMPETDAYGHSSVSDLAQGLYVVVETYVPENVTCTTAPFLVSLPTTTNGGDNWNYDVVIYPKNETGMPTLEKTLREAQADTGKHNGTTDDIADGYAHTGTGSDGDVVDYQILSTLPTITSDATALTTYTYVDTLSKGIEYNKQDVRIEWYMDSACKHKITEWTEADGKFDVAYGTADNDATTMTVTMTESGLDEINNSNAVYDLSTSLYRGYSDCTMRITYTATVNSSADMVYGDDGNPNAVTLEWRRTNMDYYDTLEDDCHFYAYGLDLLKEFNDGKGNAANVQFKIWNETDKYWVQAALNEAEGVYYVTDHVDAEAGATTFVPVEGTQKIIVKGLEDDEYVLTEIATDDKYLLLKDPITVKITTAENDVICAVCGKPGLTASATVNGDPVAMTEDNGSVSAIVPFKVTNVRGPEMPKTGDRGTWLYAAGGTMLVSLAAGGILLYVKSRRKQADEK